MKERILDFWKDFEFTLDRTMEHNKEVEENRKLKRIFENHDDDPLIFTSSQGSNYIRRSPPTSPQFKLLQ
ncbi:12992_t:CDS:2 [Entrophospora sp. SA101]|nr:12992_t:CDS:2 [Entrophospora sp. SA101]